VTVAVFATVAEFAEFGDYSRQCGQGLIIIRLYNNMADFMAKYAKFAFWTIPTLYNIKTQNAGEVTYYSASA